MTAYLQQSMVLVYRLLLAMLVMSMGRLFFLLVNWDYCMSGDTSMIWLAFATGTLFDFTILYLGLLPFILASLLPFAFVYNALYQKILKVYFITVVSIYGFMNFGDSLFFPFSGKRATWDIFHFMFSDVEISELGPMFLLQYWWLGVLLTLIIIGLWKCYPQQPGRGARSGISSIESPYWGLAGLVLAGLMFLFARGSGLKPRSILTASKITGVHYAPLALNTPLTVFFTLGKEDLKLKHYYKAEELKDIYSPVKEYTGKTFQPKNVIMIILESFSPWHSGYFSDNKTHTPFLDSLARQSLSFTNAYANNRNSINALPAILCGLPVLSSNNYLASAYAGNRVYSLANILEDKDYSSSFYYGARNGSMGFESYSVLMGYQRYMGLDEYPGPEDYDGSWGIWDEEYLLYYVKELSKHGQPFTSCVYTLTSHHPFTIPERYKKRFASPKGKIYTSIRYTDYALRRFFEEAAKTAWYANSLFVITSDHTALPETPGQQSALGVYHVPLLLYSPADSSLKGKDKRVAQQADILPTVLDYLGYNGTFLAYGHSLLSDADEAFALQFHHQIWQIIRKDKLLQFDGDKPLAMFNYEKDPVLSTNILEQASDEAEQMMRLLKAIIQDYNYRVIKNKLTAIDE